MPIRCINTSNLFLCYSKGSNWEKASPENRAGDIWAYTGNLNPQKYLTLLKCLLMTSTRAGISQDNVSFPNDATSSPLIPSRVKSSMSQRENCNMFSKGKQNTYQHICKILPKEVWVKIDSIVIRSKKTKSDIIW